MELDVVLALERLESQIVGLSDLSEVNIRGPIAMLDSEEGTVGRYTDYMLRFRTYTCWRLTFRCYQSLDISHLVDRDLAHTHVAAATHLSSDTKERPYHCHYVITLPFPAQKYVVPC